MHEDGTNSEKDYYNENSSLYHIVTHAHMNSCYMLCKQNEQYWKQGWWKYLHRMWCLHGSKSILICSSKQILHRIFSWKSLNQYVRNEQILNLKQCLRRTGTKKNIEEQFFVLTIQFEVFHIPAGCTLWFHFVR